MAHRSPGVNCTVLGFAGLAAEGAHANERGDGLRIFIILLSPIKDTRTIIILHQIAAFEFMREAFGVPGVVAVIHPGIGAICRKHHDGLPDVFLPIVDVGHHRTVQIGGALSKMVTFLQDISVVTITVPVSVTSIFVPSKLRYFIHFSGVPSSTSFVATACSFLR